MREHMLKASTLVYLMTAMGICSCGWCAIPADYISDLSGAREMCAMQPLNGGLWLAVLNNESRPEVWFSDGTPSGTVLVKSLSTLGTVWYNVAQPCRRCGDNVFFGMSYSNVFTYDLWVSDGTEENTRLLLTSDSEPEFLGDMDDIVYFCASTGGFISRLWRSDGTQEGTYPLSDAQVHVNYENPAVWGGSVLYYAAENAAHGVELWRTDGTVAGTYMVRDVNAGLDDGVEPGLVVSEGMFYFVGQSAEYGLELYRSDGTEGGTEIVADIAPGTADSMPAALTPLDGGIFFFADDGSHGVEPWFSDGSAEGTVLVKDIYPGGTGSGGDKVMVMGNAAYFFADDGLNGLELWKSDGSGVGTVMVTQFDPIPAGRNSIAQLNGVAEGHVYFIQGYWPAEDDGADFYRTDGTAEGTSFIARVYFGPSPHVQGVHSYNGTVYFGTSDVLYRLDGTTPEKVTLQDPDSGLVSQSAMVNPPPVLLGDRLYVQGENGLWAMHLADEDEDDPCGVCCFAGTGAQASDAWAFGPVILVAICFWVVGGGKYRLWKKYCICRLQCGEFQ